MNNIWHYFCLLIKLMTCIWINNTENEIGRETQINNEQINYWYWIKLTNQIMDTYNLS